MNEKDYGGSVKYGQGGKIVKNVQENHKVIKEKKNISNNNMETSDLNTEKIIQAGKIASEVKKYARSIIKKDMLLLEIADKIEDKIKELGGKPAFPTNLSINEIAAHYTPSYNDETKAHGLLKIDLGVHVDGWVADTAFSMDLEDNEENKKLIETAESARNKAIETIKIGNFTGEIGKIVQKEIESKGFSPITNLFGHQIEEYDLHAGLTIPNIDDGSRDLIEEGLYAIEPFTTNGSGRVYDGPDSGIYQLSSDKNVRSPTAREVLYYIVEEQGSLPFCSRWIVKKFGTRALIALRELQNNGNIHQFSTLIEKSKAKVAQAENTVLLTKNKKIVTSE